MSAEVYQQLDTLYNQSMEQIHSLAVPQAEATEQYDVVRTDRVKQATLFLQKMARFLDVAQLQTQQAPLQSGLGAAQLEVYRSKYQHLREVLRQKQLENYAQEGYVIHQQRLRQYEIEAGEAGEENAEGEAGEENAEGEAGEAGEEEGEMEGEAGTLQKNRKRLFSGRRKTPPKASVEDQLLQQNKDISASLRKSKQLMSMSIMQTELNIDTLDQQSQDLRKLNDKLVDLDALLGKSRQIVRFIEKQDKADKRRIYMAVGFLVLCSAYVLYRRVLKLPVKIVVWSLLKTFGVVHWVTAKSMGSGVSRPHAPGPPPPASLFPESSEPSAVPTMVLDTPYVQDADLSQPVQTWVPPGTDTASTGDVGEVSGSHSESVLVDGHSGTEFIDGSKNEAPEVDHFGDAGFVLETVTAEDLADVVDSAVTEISPDLDTDTVGSEMTSSFEISEDEILVGLESEDSENSETGEGPGRGSQSGSTGESHSQIETQSDEMEFDKNESEFDKNEMESDKNEMESDFDEMESDFDEMESDKNEMESDKNESESDKNEMESDFDEMESDKNEMESDKNESESKDTISSDFDEMKFDKNEIQSDFDEMKSDKNEMESDFDDLESKDKIQSDSDESGSKIGSEPELELPVDPLEEETYSTEGTKEAPLEPEIRDADKSETPMELAESEAEKAAQPAEPEAPVHAAHDEL